MGKAIFCLMAFNIIFFAALGKVLFEDSPIENNPFQTMFSACFTLFVLQTTSNFPDVMMPFYIDSRFASIFFMTFLFFNSIILVNMILAIFYTCYK